MDYCNLIPQIAEVDELIKDLFFSLAPLYKDISEAKLVTVPLFTALHSTSESILLLLESRGVFDADILLRCLMEGTIKYCYIMNGDKEEKAKKCEEYKTVLYEMERLADHKKAKEAIEILETFSNNNLKPFEIMILSDEDEKMLSSKYPAKKRNELLQRWSYQSLLKSLANDRKEYEAQLGTLSTYATTSHFCHFDWTGVSARNQQIKASRDRSDELFDYIHGLRILSNTLSMYIFRVIEYIHDNHSLDQTLIEKCSYGFSLVARIDNELNELIDQKINI